MTKKPVSKNFYDEIKSRLHKRIGRELRLARYVLDLGCGSCDLVRHLADVYCQQVTGVDVSSESFPKERRSRHNVHFRCLRRDASHLKPVPAHSADAVVMMWSLHEMEQPKDVLTEVHRVLRPGGELLIVDFPRGSLAQKLWNEDYFRPCEIKRLLTEAGLIDIRVRLIEQKQVIWAAGYRPPAATT